MLKLDRFQCILYMHEQSYRGSMCIMDIQGTVVGVWLQLSSAQRTADGTGKQPSPGDGKCCWTDKTAITVVGVVGEVQ